MDCYVGSTLYIYSQYILSVIWIQLKFTYYQVQTISNMEWVKFFWWPPGTLFSCHKVASSFNTFFHILREGFIKKKIKSVEFSIGGGGQPIPPNLFFWTKKKVSLKQLQMTWNMKIINKNIFQLWPPPLPPHTQIPLVFFLVMN